MIKQRSHTHLFETPWGSGSRDNRGAGLTITYGWHDIPGMGDVLIAATPRGICFIGLTVDQKRTRAENRLHDYFPAAEIAKNADATAGYAAGIDAQYQTSKSLSPLPLDLYGTPFQLSVWRALLDIPFGETVSYQNIAQAIGRDTASRAVGGAVGDNPVSILVPCHRVIQSNGDITNYGWGTPKKRTLLTMEGVAA